MVTNNMISSVIEQITKNNNVEIERIRTDYFKHVQNTNNLILPEKVQTSFSGSANLRTDTKYDFYDTKGNLLQYTLQEKTPISFIWGYNGQYPVAKIENASFSEVKTALNLNDQQIQALSPIANPANSDFTKLKNLQSQLPQTLVTIYTYKPLIGIISETDANGITIYYEYDDYGRLKLIRDNNKNIIKSYQYHYQNETP